MIRHVSSNLGVLRTHRLYVSLLLEKSTSVLNRVESRRRGQVSHQQLRWVSGIELNGSDWTVLDRRLKQSQRHLLKLIIIVKSAICIEVDRWSRGNDHVESIWAEVTVPRILHNLRKYYLLEPNSPVNHDRLSHQYHEFPIHTSFQIVDIRLFVQHPHHFF